MATNFMFQLGYLSTLPLAQARNTYPTAGPAISENVKRLFNGSKKDWRGDCAKSVSTTPVGRLGRGFAKDGNLDWSSFAF
jgi:hypothetical protein